MNVQLTPITSDFALTADDRNLIVKARKLVDPTKAPNWSARLAADPALSPEPREEWEDAGYYSLNSAGLAAALESVIYRTVSREEHTDLAAFVAEIRTFYEVLQSTLDFNALSPAK